MGFLLYLGLAVLALTSVVMTAVVMLSKWGRAVTLTGGTGPGMRIKKLPMPIQKAMTRPVTNPTTAPWGGSNREKDRLLHRKKSLC